MRAPKMHADELDIDAVLVRRLVAAQFPEWAELPVEPVLPWGTDNALFRLGEEMVVRLPRMERTVATLEKELRWLPELAARLPLSVPVPLRVGDPDESYPFPWSVYCWLEGQNATVEPIADERGLTTDLVRFLGRLHRIDPAGGPSPGEHNFHRGCPLVLRDERTREAIESLGAADELIEVWDAALGAPEWERAPVWIHGDLDGRNLLVAGGRLRGVIDWGGLGVGDPAYDVQVAWKLLSGKARRRFRVELDIDDATWARARGGTVSQAVIALSYYTPKTNPVLVAEAERWIAEVLADSA